MTDKVVAVTYYDFLDDDAKAALAEDFLAGPDASDPRYLMGISPHATPAQIEAVVVKRFHDRFTRSDQCPMSQYREGIVPPPPIYDRLVADGYLEVRQ